MNEEERGTTSLEVSAALVRVEREHIGRMLVLYGALLALFVGGLGRWIETRSGGAFSKAGELGGIVAVFSAGFFLALPLWQGIVLAYALGLLPRPFRAKLEVSADGVGIVREDECFLATTRCIQASSAGTSPWGNAVRLSLENKEEIVLDALTSAQSETVVRVLSLQPRAQTEALRSRVVVGLWGIFGVFPVLLVWGATLTHKIDERGLSRGLLLLSVCWGIALLLERGSRQNFSGKTA